MLRQLGKRLLKPTSNNLIKQTFFSTQSAATQKIIFSNGNDFRVDESIRAQAPFFVKRREEKTKLKLVIGDILGTYVGRFNEAVIVNLVILFAKFNISITAKEASVGMGKHKKVHLRGLFDAPLVAPETKSIREKWRIRFSFKKPETEEEWNIENKAIDLLVDAMFTELKATQPQVLRKNIDTFAALIPGALEAHQEMENSGLLMTATTGFNREMADVVLHHIARKGVKFRTTVACDEVENASRPNPHMGHKIMAITNIVDPGEIFKWDDSLDGLGEGQNLKCWTGGVYATGNLSGFYSNAEYEKMKLENPTQVHQQEEKAKALMQSHGAHYVMRSIADVPAVIRDINRRLLLGERPDTAPRMQHVNEEQHRDEGYHQLTPRM